MIFKILLDFSDLTDYISFGLYLNGEMVYQDFINRINNSILEFFFHVDCS